MNFPSFLPSASAAFVAQAADSFLRGLTDVWKLQIYHVGDVRVTVGKIVIALVGVIVALGVSSMISRWSARLARHQLGMMENQTELVAKVVFFPLAAMLVFTLLNGLGIPLTAFAFLGGALAIGVGFGTQNMMNNFISGLILLIERQVRIGDIVEVGAHIGRITHLGTRCSRLRKFDGVEVLIPNSAFLEKDVANWTLNDPQHRYDFTLGVAYGSPVRQVLSILQDALAAQPEILKDPAPGVFFESFGDSSLVFHLYYWVEAGGPVDARLVGSNLRCHIDSAFRDAGIEMPFPQRDIHVRGTLPVRLEK